MATNLKVIADKHAAKAKKLLLVDAAGGILSVILLMGVVARFEAYFGMPQQVVYLLSSLACLYGTYSLSCYFFLKNNQQAYLKLIAIANLVYCCIIIGLIFNFYPKLTILGLIYFSAELIIIASMAAVELAAASNRIRRMIYDY